MNRKRTRMLPAIALAAGLIFSSFIGLRSCVAGEQSKQASLVCKPDEIGSIVTWMVSEPFTVGPKDTFETDFLRDFGGEDAFRPAGITTEMNGKRLAWKVISSGKPVVKPSVVPIEDTKVFYLFTTITPQTGGKALLTCNYWSDVMIWMEGRKVISAARKWRDQMADTSAEVDLEKGESYPILVKISSALQQAALHLRFTVADAGAAGQGNNGQKKDGEDPNGGGDELGNAEGQMDVAPDHRQFGRPIDLICSLPVPADQRSLASYLPDAIDVTIDNYRFLEPDRTSLLYVGLADYEQHAYDDPAVAAKEPRDRAIPPGLDSTLSAKAVIRTRDGKELASFKLGKFDPGQLAGKPLSFSYRPKKSDVSPFFVVQVEIEHDGAVAGKFERRFYCLDGIKQLGEEISKRAERFYKEKNEEELYEDRDLAYLLLKLEQLKLLYDTEANTYYFGDRALTIVLDAQRRVEIMEKRLHINPGPGLHEFVYVSKVDDSAQPYLVYVPLSYQAMKGAPLIVYLHGYDPDLNKLNWQLIPEGLKALCEQYGYLLAAPFGRSNTDFQGIGEEDVMHVLDLVRRQYNVHSDRIFLLGYSMGAMGAYTIGGHYPDQWAGLISLAGRADFYMWRRVKPADVQPFKRWLVDLEFANGYAENFRNVPVLALQGEYDSLVENKQSINFVKKLTGLGYEAQFIPVRDMDHWIASSVFSTDTVFKWMQDKRRPDAPQTVSLTTVTLKYNKAYWLTIDDFRKWGTRAKIEAKMDAPNHVAVTETNVAAFTLDLPAKMVDTAKPVVVKVGEKEFKFDAPAKGPLKVVLDQAKPSALRKTPQLCGPFKDVHNSRFLFVYGTQGDPVENKMIYQQTAAAVDEWRRFTKAVQLLEKEKDPLMVRDRDLDDEQRDKCNLVLIGTPRTNSVLARIADKLPIKFDGNNGYIVGNRKITGPGLGMNMIYPSPFNPNRYVVVKSGLYYGLRLSDNHKFDMLPDFIIYDQDLDREIPDLYDGVPNRSRCAGFFDKYWQLDDDVTWTQD